MLRGMAEAMMDKGYVNTTVADVIARAGVSRETFYQQFSSKADCFMAAFDAAADLLMSEIEAGTDLRLSTLAVDDEPRPAHPPRPVRPGARPLPRHAGRAPGHRPPVPRRGVRRRALRPSAAAWPCNGRSSMPWSPSSASPPTMPTGRFSCEVLVAAVSTMVAEPLVSDDPTTLRDLHEPLMALVRRTADAADDGR